MKHLSYDIAVVGGGAAGLTASAKCAALGGSVLVIERNERLGGVLLQCIHSGFGLHYFHQELTGPEYAAKVREKAEDAGVSFLTQTTVMKIEQKESRHILTLYSKTEGVIILTAKAVILAMGCREKCRGNLGIPGDRPAGIFSAGTAQQLMNLEGVIPGHEAVIVGSGDIGLIMARRLTWCKVKVKCVLEIMPYAAGLSRNIAQCLEDFNIPLYLSTGITGIYGSPRVQYVTFAPLVDGKPDLTREQRVNCDTVLFSVGLVPENELAMDCNVKMNPLTGGAIVNGNMMTSIPGIFSCGNVLHVHDLVDFVSQEAEHCAECAIAFCHNDTKLGKCTTEVFPENGVRYVVPNYIDSTCSNRLFMRAKNVMEQAVLTLSDENGEKIVRRDMRYVKPAEMIDIQVPAHTAKTIHVNLEERK